MSFLRKRGRGGLNKKRKEGVLTALVTAIKKDPTISIRKHANKLKVHKKTVRTAIKQDLNPDLNPLEFAISGILENKNTTSNPNFSSLKAAFEDKLNKMSEEFILKACKLFRRHIDTITEKKWWSY